MEILFAILQEKMWMIWQFLKILLQTRNLIESVIADSVQNVQIPSKHREC